MKTKIVVGVLFLSVILVLGACQKNSNDSINNSDREFMDRMAYLHNAEVQFGNLAISKGQDATIKSFGQMMVTDHNTAMNELKTLAQQRNYGIPSNPDAEHIGLKIVLEAETGRQFDSIYIKGQVKDHVQALEMIADELSNGKDQALKNYAAKYKPIATSHKSHAEAIVSSMGF